MIKGKLSELNSNQFCSKCGSRLGRFSSGPVCAPCQLESGLSEMEQVPPEVGAQSFSAVWKAGSFGRYDLLEEIAHGGMGVVYRARDTSLNRIVAVKLILAGQFASAKEVKRFRVEAEAAARLDHPNIVPIYEVGEEDGRPFFSMKYMEGGPLTRQLAGSDKLMKPMQSVQLVVKVARAVHHAHQRAILHRDLKPGNILLDSRGEPYVSDFGLAKDLDSAEGLTISGAMLGSPGYMSPEQASANSARLTTASDIYSLGAILYHLLTGRPPFRAETAVATLALVMNQEPPAPCFIRPGLDPELETICLKCLEKEPAQRYGSAEALTEDLERWLRQEPIAARPMGPIGRFAKWTRRKPGIASLLALSICVLLAFLVGQTVMSVRLSRANREVLAANTRLIHSLYELQWNRAEEAAQSGNRAEAIAWFSHFLRENPRDAATASRLLSILSSYNYPVLKTAPLVHESALVKIDLGQGGTKLATVTAAGTARIWDIPSGGMEMELPHPAPLAFCNLAGERDSKLLTISTEPRARLWDLRARKIVEEIPLGVIDTRRTERKVLLTKDRRLIALNVRSNELAILNADSGARISDFQPPEEIRQFAFSNDGHFIALGGGSHLSVWKSPFDRPLFLPKTLTSPTESLRFSEDERLLACSSGGRIWLISTESGERQIEFQANGSPIAYVGIDGELIAGTPKLDTRLYNFRTGEDRGSAYASMAFNWLEYRSLRELLFRIKDTDRALLIDPSNGHANLEPFFHKSSIVDVQLDPSGKLAATASQDRTVRIWSAEMETASPLTIVAGGPVFEAQWSPAGDKIFSSSSATRGSEVSLWDARSGVLLASFHHEKSPILCAQWANDGSRLVTVSPENGRVWDGDTAQPISPPLLHQGTAEHCAVSPDGTIIATTGGGTIRLWDQTGRFVRELPCDSLVRIEFSRDGRRLAGASLDGTLSVWSIPEGKLQLGPLHHEGICWIATFSPDDRLLLSASSDGTARVWDAHTGQPVLSPLRHESPVYGVSFSPNGRWIATSTESGVARVWEVKTGEPVSQPMRHPNRVWFVKWSPDGRFLVTTCTDGSARVWEALSGHMVAEPFQHEKGMEVRRAEFSPDGRRLLTASYDGRIKIWDLALLRPPLPVPLWIPDLAESLGGKRIGPKDAPETISNEVLRKGSDLLQRTQTEDDFYFRWGKWMIEERLKRPVKPFQP